MFASGITKLLVQLGAGMLFNTLHDKKLLHLNIQNSGTGQQLTSSEVTKNHAYVLDTTGVLC